MMKKHIMTLETEYPSGAQLWICLFCRRQVICRWQPNIRNIVLEDGDTMAKHSGWIGIQASLRAQVEDKNQFPTELKDQIDEILRNID